VDLNVTTILFPLRRHILVIMKLIQHAENLFKFLIPINIWCVWLRNPWCVRVERWKTQTTSSEPHYRQADRSTATGKCEPRKWYPHVSVTLFALCIQSNRVPSHDSLFCESLTPNIFDRTDSAIHTKANIYLTISLRVELCWLPRSICACSWDESAPERCAIAAEKLKRAPRICIICMCVMREENESKPRRS
jgi:hypothetical protein